MAARLAYPATALALWHGIAAGPDAWNPVIRIGYGVALAATALGVILRLGSYLVTHRAAARPRPVGTADPARDASSGSGAGPAKGASAEREGT